MMKIEIRATDTKQIKGAVKGLDKQSPTLLSRAINRAATTAQTAIGNSKTGVPGYYRIQQKEVKPAIKIKTANKSELVAVVEIKGRSRPLVKFTVSPKKLAKRKGNSGRPKVYKAAVFRRNGIKALSGAPKKPFYAVTKNGTEGIFSRKETRIQKQIRIVRRSKRGAGVKIYKYKSKVRTGEPYEVDALQMHFGPSIPQMVENTAVMKKVQHDASNMLQSRLQHEVSRYLERLEK